VSKQFKQASAAGVNRVILIGEELDEGKVAVKELASGVQKLLSIESLLADPKQALGE
jgi:histidyl-tRNA synthetase